MNEIGVRIPDYNFVTLENVKMATEKAPTRDEIMEELSKKGINNLVELLDALMPDETETGGYGFKMDGGEGTDGPDYFADMFRKFRGHGADGWMIPVAAGIHSLYGEFSY